MKFQLNMEKPAVITTEVPVVKQVESTEASSKHSYKKIVIVSVAAICVTVAVVAGFVFAFKTHADTTSDIVKKVIETDGVKETVESNPKENTKLYTIFLNDGKKQYMLYDFNRRMKIAKYDGRCMVSSMNHTEKDVEEMNEDDHDNTMYQFDMTPVVDKSFLSNSAAELCQDSHVHWAFPQCGNSTSVEKAKDDVTETDRSKRATRRYTCPWWYSRCCITACGWRVCSCKVVLYHTCNYGRCRCDFYFGC